MLWEVGLAAVSVSIETGSTFFLFQLGLIDPLIDRAMSEPRLLDDPHYTRRFEAEYRGVFLREAVSNFRLQLGLKRD